jgi:hypothetical protein
MCPEVDSASENEYQGVSPAVKAADAFGWRPTTLVVPKVEKIRGLNLLGTPWATTTCCGLPLPFLHVSTPRVITMNVKRTISWLCIKPSSWRWTLGFEIFRRHRKLEIKILIYKMCISLVYIAYCILYIVYCILYIPTENIAVFTDEKNNLISELKKNILNVLCYLTLWRRNFLLHFSTPCI